MRVGKLPSTNISILITQCFNLVSMDYILKMVYEYEKKIIKNILFIISFEKSFCKNKLKKLKQKIQ